MRRPIARLRGSTGGNALIEFALVAPVIIALTGGIVEFGLAFQVYNGVNRLAAQYAAAWADCSDYPTGTCGSELTAFTASNTVGNVAPQLVPSRLSLSMFQVQMTGTTPTVVYAYPAGNSLTAAQTTAAQSAFTNGQSGVIVTATYNHSLLFFSTLMNPFLGNALTASYTITQLKS